MLNWWSTHSINLPLSAALSALLGISEFNIFIQAQTLLSGATNTSKSSQVFSVLKGEVTADGHTVMCKMFILLSYIRTFNKVQCANVLV